MGELGLVAFEATLAQPVLQRPRGDADPDHLHVDRRPVEALRGRGDEGRVGQVGAEGCVDHHGTTEAEVGPGDVEQRVVLEGQDVVDTIAGVSRNQNDKPREPVVMERVYIEETAA